MKQIIYGILVTLFALLVLNGCKTSETLTKEDITQICCSKLENLGSNVPQGQIGMPNPSSYFCNCMGGKSITKISQNGGQYGVCKIGFSEQEEWSYLKEKCPSNRWTG